VTSETRAKVAIAIGAAVVIASGVTLFVMRRASRSLGATERRKPYKRPKKETEPVFFVDPDTGDVIELDQSTAEYKRLRGH